MWRSLFRAATVLLLAFVRCASGVECRQCVDSTGKGCETGSCTGDMCILTYDRLTAGGVMVFVKKGCLTANTTYAETSETKLDCRLVMDFDTMYSVACTCREDLCNEKIELPPKLSEEGDASLNCIKGTPKSQNAECKGSACFFSSLSLGCVGFSPITALQLLVPNSTKAGPRCTVVNDVEQCVCDSEKCNQEKPAVSYLGNNLVECHKCMSAVAGPDCGTCQGHGCVLQDHPAEPFKNERYCINSTAPLQASCTSVALQSSLKTYTMCTCLADGCNSDLSTAQPFVRGSLEAGFLRKDDPMANTTVEVPEKPLSDDPGSPAQNNSSVPVANSTAANSVPSTEAGTGSTIAEQPGTFPSESATSASPTTAVPEAISITSVTTQPTVAALGENWLSTISQVDDDAVPADEKDVAASTSPATVVDSASAATTNATVMNQIMGTPPSSTESPVNVGTTVYKFIVSTELAAEPEPSPSTALSEGQTKSPGTSPPSMSNSNNQTDVTSGPTVGLATVSVDQSPTSAEGTASQVTRVSGSLEMGTSTAAVTAAASVIGDGDRATVAADDAVSNDTTDVGFRNGNATVATSVNPMKTTSAPPALPRQNDDVDADATTAGTTEFMTTTVKPLRTKKEWQEYLKKKGSGADSVELKWAVAVICIAFVAYFRV